MAGVVGSDDPVIDLGIDRLTLMSFPPEGNRENRPSLREGRGDQAALIAST
jgi:hypothetical protein